MKMIICLFAIVAMIGCGTPRASNDLVPKTLLNWEVNPKKSKGNLELPKDYAAEYANIERETNGKISITFSNIVSSQNPSLVKEAGRAQADGIREQAQRDKALFELLQKVIPATAGKVADEIK